MLWCVYGDGSRATSVESESVSYPTTSISSQVESVALPAPCFGSLCDYSAHSILPSTAYRVILAASPLPVNSSQSTPTVPSEPIEIGPASTLPSQLPPELSTSTAIETVAAKSFEIRKVGQSKSGKAYVIISSMPQQFAQLKSGAMTPFVNASTGNAVTGSSNSRRLQDRSRQQPSSRSSLIQHSHSENIANASAVGSRVLQQAPAASSSLTTASTGLETWLPTATNASATNYGTASAGISTAVAPTTGINPGSIVGDSCSAAPPCATRDSLLQRHPVALPESVVHFACINLDTMTEFHDHVVPNLLNNTQYKAAIITEDAVSSATAVYTAYLHTLDLTPPVFTNISAVPVFTSFRIRVQLDESGTVYAAVTAGAERGSPITGCPPKWEV